MRIRKHRKYSLLNKKNSGPGRISFMLFLLSLSVLVAAVYMAFTMKGNAGAIVGVLGCVSLAVSIGGFVTGLVGFKDEEKRQLYSWIGSISNGVIWIVIAGMILAYC